MNASHPTRFRSPGSCLASLLVGLLVCLGPTPSARSAQPNVLIVRSVDTATRIYKPSFQQPVRNAFRSCRLTFVPDTEAGESPDKASTLALMRQADIFYINTHASLSTFAFLARDGLLSPAEMQAAIRSPERPALVIVNGCAQTAPADPSVLRAYHALGLTDETRGRAFLGWRTSVVGFQGDDYFAQFLAYWMKPQAENQYPTLEETRQYMQGKGTGTSISNNLDIVGDQNLRFDLAMGYVGRVRLVNSWQLIGCRLKTTLPDGSVILKENASFNGTDLAIFKDATYKLVLRAVDTRTQREGVVAVVQDQPWYLTRDGPRIVLNFTLEPKEGEPQKWHQLWVTANGNKVELLDPTGNAEFTFRIGPPR